MQPPKELERHRPALRRATLTLLVLASGLGIALACQVPVFRYALERWEPDAFEVVVIGAELLDSAQQEAVAYLRGATTGAEDRTPANLRVTEIDSENAPPPPEPSANVLPEIRLPRFELRYPPSLRGFLPDAFWTGEVTMANAQKILHSPMREEIVRRLLSGNSATWILVESGDKEKDDNAAQSLESFCREAEKTLKVPDGVIGASDVSSAEYLSPGDAENVLQSEVPLKIAFSVVRLSRDDPAEEILSSMLLSVEDDLGDYKDQPIAFPVFGRGRVLQPLIGAGLTLDNVMFDSSYLCGACSCQVKEENPGIDLLVAAAWDAALRGSEVIVEKMLPPLEGTAALLQSATGAEQNAAAVTSSDPATDSAVLAKAPGSNSPLKVTAVILGVILLGVAFVTLKLKRNSA